MTTRMLTTIGFDADDTLWQNEQYYRLTEAHFTELLADFANGPRISERLLEAEKRNLRQYGFGIKGFTLSMMNKDVIDLYDRAPVGTKVIVVGPGNKQGEISFEDRGIDVLRTIFGG